MKITVVSVVVLAVCIVVAQLLLVALRQVAGDLPLDDGWESSIAAGVGALVWVLIMPRIGR